MTQFVEIPEKVLVPFGTALTSSTADITVTRKPFSDQEWAAWLATIPDPIEPAKP